MSVLHVVAGVLCDGGGRVLLAQRGAGRHLAGRWEFPGGKRETGESREEALRRELAEEIGVRVRAARPLIAVDWDYPDRRVHLDVWRVQAYDGAPVGREGQALRWVHRGDLHRFELPPADAPVLAALRLPERYLITPEPDSDGDEDGFVSAIAARVSAGLRLVQLRAPALAPGRLAAIAERAARACSSSGATLLVNRDVDLARRLPGVGVHLSAAQLDRLAERPLPADRLVGASCHDARELERAERLGVDFVVLGPVQATASHPGAAPMGWDAFAALVSRAHCPVYALGGVGPRDLDSAWAAGAQGVAGISALWRD
jgi:8-oxo-dGTP diphosphatase